MLVERFEEVYDNFKLKFYSHILKGFEDREASLSTIEVFCLESINALKKPTISEVSEFMNVSKQNMSYRISNLEEKGYVIRTQSEIDKREFFVEVTEKFEEYHRVKEQYIIDVLGELKEEYPKEDLELFEEMLTVIAKDLMPEISSFKNDLRYNKE